MQVAYKNITNHKFTEMLSQRISEAKGCGHLQKRGLYPKGRKTGRKYNFQTSLIPS